jgi:methionyl-tRNA formyltransferase
MRTVFVGASAFGLKCLERCLALPGVEVVGVVTAERHFKISYAPGGVNNIRHADLSAIAAQHTVPVAWLQRSMSDPELLRTVAAWKPTAFVVAGWYHMIPRSWRDMAPAYGLHASLLPDYSGGAPLVWAMIHGETATGITLFKMDDGVDSGPIAAQASTPIHPDDTIATLYARVEELALDLLKEVLPRLASGTQELRDQPNEPRRVMPQRTPEDGWIDWNQDAQFVARWIRAQTRPYPGAFTSLNGDPLHIWSATAVETHPEVVDPGKVRVRENGCYRVDCGAGSIELGEVTHAEQTYRGGEITKLLGEGGQKLGSTRDCLKRFEPC